MSFNVGGMDRVIRLVVGLVLFALAVFHVFTGALGIIVYVLAGIALVTAIFGFCPAWTLFGINTRAAKAAK
jgi:hypothetical protein